MLSSRMSGSSNAGAAHRARRSLSSACGWTGVDAEVAYALESDDETFSCDQDVGNDSDEDTGESPDTPAAKCPRLSDSWIASSSSSVESPADAMGTDDGSGQANTAQKSDEEIAQKLNYLLRVASVPTRITSPPFKQLT